jgi:NADH dehydrogenase
MKVVIIGGGFGGLYAAKALGGKDVEVVVLDRTNYHLFQPLLYQVATAALSPGDIASPIRSILRKHRNVSVQLGEVKSVDLAKQKINLEERELTYDALIVATGARHAYFGHSEWEPLAPGLKSLDDALEMRRRILFAFEAAEVETDLARRAALLTFVIVGGGPTGVELAGAIAEISRHTVARDFRSIDPRQAQVLLLEAGPRILAAFPEKLSAKAVGSLERLGVKVRTGAAVTQIDQQSVHLGSEVIPTFTTLWAAGVAASPLARSLGVPLDRAGRVIVGNDLSIPGHPSAFVVGDLACFTPEGDSRPLPGLAPVAMQQGTHAAANVRRLAKGEATVPFRYKDKGTMATIGRAHGIAVSGKLQMSGFLGWLAWLFIHVLFLIGFKNRMLVMIQWAWQFFTYKRGARLITGEPRLPAQRLTSHLEPSREKSVAVRASQ